MTVGNFNAHLRDNLLALDQHAHSGSSGDGSTTLGNLVKVTLTDAAAPSAPGAGLTVFYTVSGRPFYRAGAGGSSTQLADSADLHAQTHATAHEPSGADTMAVDAAAGTGSLRTVGSGATQAAAGDHTHTTSDEYSNHDDGANNNADCTNETDVSTHVRTVGATGRSWIMFAVAAMPDNSVTFTLRLKFDTTTRVTRSGLVTGQANECHAMEFLEVNPSAASHTVRLTGEETANPGNNIVHGATGVIEVSVA